MTIYTKREFGESLLCEMGDGLNIVSPVKVSFWRSKRLLSIGLGRLLPVR